VISGLRLTLLMNGGSAIGHFFRHKGAEQIDRVPVIGWRFELDQAPQ
jgi:hypothetical protein